MCTQVEDGYYETRCTRVQVETTPGPAQPLQQEVVTVEVQDQGQVQPDTTGCQYRWDELGVSMISTISTISTISRWEGEGEDMQWVLIQGTCTNTQTTQTTGQAGGQGRILGLGLGLGVNAGLNLGINAGFGINAGLGAGAGAGTGAGAAGQNCNKQWVSRPR